MEAARETHHQITAIYTVRVDSDGKRLMGLRVVGGVVAVGLIWFELFRRRRKEPVQPP